MIVEGMTEADYHRHPALSQTTAKTVLDKCPAVAVWQRAHPEVKDAYTKGSVVHKLILGVGPEIVVVEADSWSKKADQVTRREVRERGAVAMLPTELAECELMAQAVLTDPIAALLLAPGFGVPEQAVMFKDPVTGLDLRAMLDWFPAPDAPGRPMIVDVKSTKDVSVSGVQKAISEYRYYQQHPWYVEAAEACGVVDPAFVFVFVGVDPPHLVTCVQLDEDAVMTGADRNRRAREIWADCLETGVFPGYADGIVTASLTRWAAR